MALDFLFAHANLLVELGALIVGLILIVVLSGLLIARLDGLSAEDGIYFAFVTALTVGFGDFVPRSRGARLLSILLAIIGIVIFGIIVSVTVHALDIAIDASPASGNAATTP